MLNNGTDRVTPAQSMWPLFCNEINLSYEQEEKVRQFQKALLFSQESWLDRHAAFASVKVIESTHDTVQAFVLRCGQRERFNGSILTNDQRAKFLAWAARNRKRMLATVQKGREGSPSCLKTFRFSEQQHLAANLYVANHGNATILQTIPRAAPIVTGHSIKKLMVRPLFESLGGCSDKKEKENRSISRDSSFASCGSLKRAASEISMDGTEERQTTSVSPPDAETMAMPLIERVLGFLKEIIPAPPKPTSFSLTEFSIPAPTPVASIVQQGYTDILPGMKSTSDSDILNPSHSLLKHQRQSSFLPDHLNVVPEEMWPVDGTTEDFLLNLVDGDWAIGEGIDMDELE